MPHTVNAFVPEELFGHERNLVPTRSLLCLLCHYKRGKEERFWERGWKPVAAEAEAERGKEAGRYSL